MRKFKYTAVLLLVLAGFSVKAQDDYVMQFMRLSPYANYYNPASFISQKLYVGVPIASNFSMNISNNWFKYDNLFKTDEQGKPIGMYNSDEIISKLDTVNAFDLDFDFHLIDLGIRFGRFTLTVAERIRWQNDLSFSKDFLGLIFGGNLSYAGVGNEAKVDLGVNSTMFAETSVGVQLELTRRLYLGGRAKLLNGVYNLQTNHIGFDLFTDPDTYEMTVSNFGADVDVMAIEDIDYQEGIPACFTNKFNEMKERNWGLADALDYSNKNKGLALDLGAVYRISDHLGVSVSVTDLGYIHWNCKGTKIVSDTTLSVSGFTVDELRSMFNDSSTMSLDEFFPYTVSDVDFDIRKSLVPTYMGEAYFQFGRSRISGAVRKRGDVVAMTGAASLCLGNFINVCGSYTKLNYTDVPVLGAGAEMNLGFANLYVMTSNSVWSFDENANADFSKINLKIGALVNFGVAKERRVNVKDSGATKKKVKKSKTADIEEELDLDDLLAPEPTNNEINVYEQPATEKKVEQNTINIYVPAKTEDSNQQEEDAAVDEVLDELFGE